MLLTSVALLFYIKKPDGRPYLELSMFERYSEKVSDDVSDFASQGADTLSIQAKKLTEKLNFNKDVNAPVLVYKWQDDKEFHRYLYVDIDADKNRSTDDTNL